MWVFYILKTCWRSSVYRWPYLKPIYNIGLLQSPPSRKDGPKASKGTSMCKDLLSIKRPMKSFLCLKSLSEALYAQNFRNSLIYLRSFGGLLCRGILEEFFPVKRGLSSPRILSIENLWKVFYPLMILERSLFYKNKLWKVQFMWKTSSTHKISLESVLHDKKTLEYFFWYREQRFCLICANCPWEDFLSTKDI